jgi:uncharacterized protein (TIGR03437 family)
VTARPAKNGTALAGTFSSVDAQTRAVSNAGLQWIEHTLAGTRLGTANGVTFMVDWTAPSSIAGDVVFYAAGVAGDGQDTGFTDLVYSTKLTVPLAPDTVIPKPVFTADGVADAWGNQPGIAPGAWVTIQGTDLGEPASISAVAPNSVTFLVPSDISAASASVVLARNGIASDPVMVPVSPALPAILATPNPTYPVQLLATIATAGAGFGVQLINPTGTMIGSNTIDSRVTRPALLGEPIDIYVTGLGMTTPFLPTDRLPDGVPSVAGEVTVHFGSISRTVDEAVLIGPGIYLVRTTIPTSLPLYLGLIGLRIDVNGIYSPSNVYLNVVDPATVN